MGRFLIVNADDFGLCEEITRGILTASENGIVTSVSVVANGSYFQKGINLLEGAELDTGLHLTFVGGEKPVSGAVGGLVDEEGLFLKGYREVIARILTRRFDKAALKKEFFEQAVLMKDAGLTISHIDSHQHLHLLPVIANMAIELAGKFKVRWVRTPSSGKFTVRGTGMNILGKMLKFKLKKNGIRYTNWNEGFDCGGRLNEERLLSLLTNIKNGVSELIVHPGYDAGNRYDWGYSWEGELAALTSAAVKKTLEKKGITLTGFSGLQ